MSGWRVPELDGSTVELAFRPQRAFELSLALSFGGVAVCLVLLLRRRRS